MTDQNPKRDGSDKAETDAAQPLPSRAREREAKEPSDLTDAPTLTDAEVSAANAAYQVRFKRVDELVGYARNARTHSDAQVAQLMASIVQWGFVGAIIADEKGIVAGHGRVMAARKLYAAGLTIKAPNGTPIPKGCVPWVDCTGWSEADRRAYILADNQLAANAGWDNELLKLELGDLAVMDFNLDLTGFDSGAIDAMFKSEAAEGEGDDEPALDEPEAPTVIHCPKCAHQFSVLEEKPAKGKRRKAA